MFMFWVLTTRPRKDHNTQIPLKTIRYNAYHSGVGCLYGYTKAPTTAGLGGERNGQYTVQVHRRGISCDAETDEVVERNQCEYDPS